MQTVTAGPFRHFHADDRREGRCKTQPVIRYQDRRLVAILFDFSTMGIPEQSRVQKTAIDISSTKT